jgi:hypothetical protein
MNQALNASSFTKNSSNYSKLKKNAKTSNIHIHLPEVTTKRRKQMFQESRPPSYAGLEKTPYAKTSKLFR